MTLRRLGFMALAILCAMAFTVSGEGYVGMSDPPASTTSYLWSALALCFLWLFLHVYEKKAIRLTLGAAGFGLLFGVVNALASLLFAYDSWDMLKRPLQMGLLLARAFGQGLPMATGFVWLHHMLTKSSIQQEAEVDASLPVFRRLRVPALWRTHPTLACMLLLILCWSPYLLVFYPGTVCWDLGEMAAQFLGKYPLTTWHTVFGTWLFGVCISLGRLLHSDNLGALLFMLLQTAGLSYALARAYRFVADSGVSRLVRYAVLAFFAFVPLFGGYAQFISKDTLYTAALVLFTLEVAALVGGRKTSALCFFAWGLLSCLLRNNGLYVVLPTSLICIGYIWLARAKGDSAALEDATDAAIKRPLAIPQPRARIKLTASLSCAVILALLFSNVLVPLLGITDTSASGIYSVCFQQSARALRDEPITPDEYAAIDSILDAEHLAELYEPWISDPVKFTFRQFGQGIDIERAALTKYRDAWLSMLPKYPLTYAESFFAGNISYYAFLPKIEGETYNQQAGNRLVFETVNLGDVRGDDPLFLKTTQPAFLQPFRTLLAAFARAWRHIPLLGLLYACATYTWLLVAAAYALARERRWRRLIAFLPALLTLAVCMLSPVNDYLRYFLPIVGMTPVLIGFSRG